MRNRDRAWAEACTRRCDSTILREELKAQLAELETKQQRTGSISFKVSDKGAVSVYGLGRFPVTLYYEQWLKLLDREQDLRGFLEESKLKLKLKD